MIETSLSIFNLIHLLDYQNLREMTTQVFGSELLYHGNAARLLRGKFFGVP